MRARFLCFIAGSALVASVAGCGSHSAPPGPNLAKTYPVEGKVLFKDKSPLRGGIIYFTPVETKDGSHIRYEGNSLIDAEGHFKIGLNGNEAGVAEGDYKVSVMPRDYKELPNSNSARISNPYRNQGTTPITLKVKPEKNTFQVEIQ